MTTGHEGGTDPRRNRRLIARLDTMVASGRVTEQEAAALRAASGPGQFDDVLRQIRLRHASTRLGSAVEDGSMSREEADGFLVRLKNGEHPRSLRAHLGKLRPGAAGRTKPPTPEPPG
jgi:hypothetical protein